MSLSRCCIVHPVAIWACNPLEVNTLNLEKVIALTRLVWAQHCVCVCVSLASNLLFFLHLYHMYVAFVLLRTESSL